MPALSQAPYTATITWLGRVPDRGASLRAEPLDNAEATFAGISGEAHGGTTRPCCARFAMLHPRDHPIRNTRQLTIVSAEEMAQIAAAIGLDALDPGLIGASMVIEGIPDLSHLPPASRLQTAAGTTLTVDLENGPCHHPGKEIEAEAPGHGAGFKQAALTRRGVTAWIEREGPLAVGDRITLFVPTQRAWAPKTALAEAAG